MGGEAETGPVPEAEADAILAEVEAEAEAEAEAGAEAEADAEAEAEYGDETFEGEGKVAGAEFSVEPEAAVAEEIAPQVHSTPTKRSHKDSNTSEKNVSRCTASSATGYQCNPMMKVHLSVVMMPWENRILR